MRTLNATKTNKLMKWFAMTAYLESEAYEQS